MSSFWSTSVTDVYRRDVGVSVLLVLHFHVRYFALGVFALGEGDAAGEGLRLGLGLFAGALPVAPLVEGELDGDGLAVAGEFELLTGSQPAANTIERIVRRRRAARLIMFIFGVLISFLPHFSKIEKRDNNCPVAI